MHPFHSVRESTNARERAKSHLKGYATGGDVAQDAKMIRSAIGQHDKQLHGGAKTKLKLPSLAEGAKSRPRLDRVPHARGGRAGKKATTVNVMVNAAPMDSNGTPVPVPVPTAGPPAMPPAAPPMAGPPGGVLPPRPPMMRARGGRTYTAGAGSGEGREEKIAAYGANAKIKDTTKAVKGVKGEDK